MAKPAVNGQLRPWDYYLLPPPPQGADPNFAETRWPNGYTARRTARDGRLALDWHRADLVRRSRATIETLSKTIAQRRKNATTPT